MRLTTRNLRRWRGTEPWEDLAAVAWFAGLGPDVLRIAGRSADWVDVSAGTCLQRQDRHAGWVWVAVSGPLELRRNGERVGEIEVGGAYGEAEVLRGTASPVDVVAPSATTVVSLPARAFHGLLGETDFAALVARRQVPPQPAEPEVTRLVPVPVPRYPTGSGARVTSTASSGPSA